MSESPDRARPQQLRQEAYQMWSEALHLSGLTVEDMEALSLRMQLRGDRLYEFEVSPWELPIDASVPLNTEAEMETKIAALLLDAGRRFETIYEHEYKQENAEDSLARGLVCLRVAMC